LQPRIVGTSLYVLWMKDIYVYTYIYIYIIYNKGVLVVLDSVTVDFPKQSGIRNCIWCMVCYSKGPSVRPGAA
jgi:succinate dehydrogenase/fumarate reductase-like Fe-S protein